MRDTPQRQPDGSWRLNPQSPFPLIIEAGEEKVILSLRRALDANNKERVFFLVSKHDLRCRELEAWVQDFRKDFLESVDRQRAASPEYQALLANPDATMNRRRKLDLAFKKTAYYDLRIRPRHDFSGVFEERKEERIHAVSDLLLLGYLMAKEAAHREQQHQDLHPTYWLITTGPNTCTYCKQFEGKHPSSYRARIPIHIGCTCTITAHQ